MSRLLRRLFLRSAHRRRPPAVIRRAAYSRARLMLQALEGRIAPALFTVTNANDLGAGSLRDAIARANANADVDVIVFSAFFSTPQTITLQSALPVIANPVTIAGPGAGLLTVRRDPAAANFRIFTLDASPSTLSGMTITGGRAVQDRGGGVLVRLDRSATVQDAVIAGNFAAGPGGGIFIEASSATAGSLTVRNSTISGNDSGNAGGGIHADRCTLLVENSTISGNTSTFTGGGVNLVNVGNAANWTFRNTTISGNTAGNSGGGIMMDGGSNSLTVQNSTIANNAANGTVSGQGGGIARTGGGSVVIVSTIIANNPVSQAPDLVGSVFADFSLIRNPAGTTITGNNNVFSDPRVGPLANNGGATQTLALLPGSPAMNVGSNPAGLTTDQRGTGFARVVGAAADIGAFEVNVPTASGTFGNVTTPGGTSYTLTVTYADLTAIDVSTLDGSDLLVTGPNDFIVLATFVSVDTNTNGTPRTATYRIAAPSTTFDPNEVFDPADNGTYTVSVQPSQVFSTTGTGVAAGGLGSFQVLIPLTVTNANNLGAGSLRAAITQANADALADTIVFSAFFSTAQTISLLTALPNITNPVTITGPGAGLLTVRRDPAAGSFSIFSVFSSATLSGMTITGGQSSSQGGGISGSGSTLTVRNSTIAGNTAGASGGGISMSAGTLLVENSTISGNTTPGEGGGVYLTSFGPANWTVRNTTITGNTAGTSGGGVMMRTAGGGTPTLVVQNSTIAGNTANGTASGQGGGGIAKTGLPGTVSIASTIVANNVNTPAPDVLGSVTANFSLVRNQTGAGVGGANNLPADTNPLLGSLANNGGPTQTLALGAGSPAINAGSNPAGLTTDQRGQGFARIGGTATDIGAFEVQVAAPITVASVVVNTGQANLTQRSIVTSVTVTFSGLVTFAGSAVNTFQLARTGPNTPTGNVTLAVDLSGSTGSQTIARLTFSGALSEGLANSLIDGNYTLTVFGNQISGGLQGGDNLSSLSRLYGDVNGDKAVNGLDLAAFRTAFGTTSGNPNYVSYLDQNGDGAINGLDLAQFRTRFGTTLP